MFVMTYKMEEERRERHMRTGFVVGAVAATAVGAVIASLSTKTDTAWYQSLTLSPLQPPPLVFALVWTVLYVLLAIAFGRIVSRRQISRPAVIGFIVNIVLNALWSPIFFLMQMPAPALVVMIALIGNLIILMRNTYHADRVAFRLLIPYLVWLCIATILNVSIIALN